MEKRKKHVPRRGYQEQSSGETHVAGREKGASGAEASTEEATTGS